MVYICSAQSRNLRNLEIALRILRILKLRSKLLKIYNGHIYAPSACLCSSCNFQLG